MRGSPEARARRFAQQGADAIASACAGGARPSGCITAVIPCYLPNEQDIIEETITWIMRRVESPGPLEVLLVYNTPHDLPAVEARLRDLAADEAWPQGRRLRVMRVMDSRSKAANLNAALQAVKDPHVVIYDADHHPDPQSLLLLFEKMVREGLDCVQGSYYMRNLSENQFGCSPWAFPFLARIVDAEFFTDWFLMKLVARIFLGSGYFSGSNALWRTEILASRRFDVAAQTEDVDMAIQQLLDGRRIEFCPESRSGELAPMNMAALWKQRLRWTIGWDETSLKHSGAFTDSGRLSLRARFGLVWTFLVRWAMTVLTVVSVYVGAPLTVYWPLRDPVWGGLIFWSGTICFVAGAVPWLCATLEALIRAQDRGLGDGLVQALFVFIVASPFGFAAFFVLSFLLQVTSFYKLCIGGVKGWEVTARGPQKPGAGGQKAAAADGDVEGGGSDTASTIAIDSDSRSQVSFDDRYSQSSQSDGECN